ncbi:hypothetical protein HDU76_013591 [Blyttiomyces sp. JEL0837]|nr:hypothetical protein HDU76_013591 [Blyttiomyces sp. JEL0837]
MLIVCDDELATHRALAAGGGRKSRAAEAVEEEITNMLSGKTYEQLVKIQGQVERRLAGDDGPVDVEFWEAVMKALVVWRAKARLRDMHKFLLKKRLEHLKTRAAEEADEKKDWVGGEESKKGKMTLGRSLLVGPSAAAASAQRAAEAMKELAARADLGSTFIDTASLEEEVAELYDGSMDPIITEEVAREDRHLDVVDEEEDYEALLAHRKKILASVAAATKQVDKDDSKDASQISAVVASMDNDGEEQEEEFNEEAVIATKTSYLWQDKYRPRKPRYFNRVHTGYEWNKYNQTHYDSDNPPPKVVQGYKFNIFYPDLIDKSKAPTYKIERDEGFPDTVILRFIASAPYEDIAFRVVNREWEYSHKKGFRSSFDRGVLQLHFHFKRHYYRR